MEGGGEGVRLTTLTPRPRASLAEGLNRGEAPLSDTRVLQAVNLTTDPRPEGHGLDGGGHVLTQEESATYSRQFGWQIPAGTVFADKTEVRLTVKVRSTDPRLKRWLPWSRKNCEPGYPERLAAAAGGIEKAKTWWLFFGTIPPSAIAKVDQLKGENT
jgi:hypothetical protein